MSNEKEFQRVIEKFRKYAISERDKGDKFERLIQAYLQTDPKYASLFSNVWLWNDFFARKDLGGNDTGIDLVAMTTDGDFWAIQCKCYQAGTTIGKSDLDKFLSTSSKTFTDESLKSRGFAQRMFISTTNKWGTNAEEAIRFQSPPVIRVNLYDLEQAPVEWEKLEKGMHGEDSRSVKKSPFPHQQTAINAAHEYFKDADRGKLIMACGTGKTYTSLKIAENETGGKGLVLFLVPSIALLSQALREWYAESSENINAICICSDSQVSKKRTNNDDTDGFSVLDLALPASTNVKEILKRLKENEAKSGMTVIFSTYQSIAVIAEAQKELLKINGDNDKSYGIFDLIICDEAHRTTGITLSNEDESAFVKVHNNDLLKAKKRLYMTATPRLFNDDSKSRAAQADAILCSMDDPKIYGEEIYRIGFGEAVEKGLLSDYKVLILTLSANDVPPAMQIALAREGEISSDDASKLIGCINALSKQILGDDGELRTNDPEPMLRAVAFCQRISDSEQITKTFNASKEVYLDSISEEKRAKMVSVTSKHIDGRMSAPQRDELLSWLKSTSDDAKECKILTNVRCLSEGVDVPSLDAVLFLSARNSQVDVVQSVGRVMRKSPNKQYGYIIIPIIVPSDIEASKALDDNDRYRVVWTVLNALRAHDDRFNATVNRIELNKKRPSQILVGRPDTGLWDGDSAPSKEAIEQISQQLTFQFEQLQNVVFARMVEKVGDRRYWEQWAKDVAQIAERQLDRINLLIKENPEHQKAFGEFLSGLQKNINPAITQNEAVEMLSQHIITRPVFEALFEGYSFVKNNPISLSMQGMLDLLEDTTVDKDTETLDKFYESVKMRAKGIDNAAAKQKIILELYDKFFKTAFPKMVERLGIVYTPVELVDFMIHSVNDVLIKEFGRSLTDENIHFLDPFTGTATFITRLLQSGLIDIKDLERKYENEIHANEIVLLAYYIAAVNIENAYHELLPDKPYKPFEGICLTDTFQLGETDDSEKLFSNMFPQNSERVQKQKKAPIRVIVSNPPYSVGQKSVNDNAKNQSYKKLDSKIAQTYAKESNANLNKSLYDSYIKAFRWSTDRLDAEHGGIIAFVTNGAWLDSNSTDGFRKYLEKEFSSIYVFNLRGNQRTSGELSRKEGGKIFGSGSRTPIAITLLVKNPKNKGKNATIFYHDIGDYLNREEKLAILRKFKTVSNPEMNWKTLLPNTQGDWLTQRNDIFETYIPVVPENKSDSKTASFFQFNSCGIATSRDAWEYNFSKSILKANIDKTISYYNEQRVDFNKITGNNKIEDFINRDPEKIVWTDTLIRDAAKNIEYIVDFEKYKRTGIYRPFFKQCLYFNKLLIHRVYQQPKIFPLFDTSNRLICISGIGASKGFSVLITDCISNYHFLDTSQCFPLYYYEEQKKANQSLFDAANENELIRREAISDFIFGQAQKLYGNRVTKEDIFYYVYGFLHSPAYRTLYESNLKKMLPRIPLVDEPRDFWAFSKAGRALAELHINYEKVPPYEGVTVKGSESGYFHVEKMRFPKKDQKDAIIYNSKIIIENIPTKAYEYVVNGKSAIEWIIERYQITTHKESGIKNDPNDWSQENPRYILDLLLSIITVSMETVKIVEGLPKLKIAESI